MEKTINKRNITRRRRVMRVRKKLKGTAQKPRLCVSKTTNNLYAQFIDDENHRTICAKGLLSKQNKVKINKNSAKELGKQLAEIARKHKVSTVVFDRGRFQYHGIIAELANAVREAGLQF